MTHAQKELPKNVICTLYSIILYLLLITTYIMIFKYRSRTIYKYFEDVLLLVILLWSLDSAKQFLRFLPRPQKILYIVKHVIYLLAKAFYVYIVEFVCLTCLFLVVLVIIHSKLNSFHFNSVYIFCWSDKLI